MVRKPAKLAPVSSLAAETVRSGTQKLRNPEISGVGYQRGELFGFEVREYLLEKWGRKCAYCGAENVPLQIGHIVPKAKGGSDRVSSLALFCAECSQKKGARPLEEFLAKKPEPARQIKARAKAPLKDAAAVSSARWAVWNAPEKLSLPMAMGSGGVTKYNRTRLGIPKSRALDAARAGKVSEIAGWERNVLFVRRVGRGSRQRTRVSASGFPKGRLTRS